MKGGSTTCNPLYPTTGSLDQGVQFAKLTASFHGGAKKSKQSKSNKNAGKNRKMVRRGTRRMRGGALFTPYADYPTSFTATLPTELHDPAKVAPLDAKFAELPDVMKSHGVQLQAGGGRKTRRASTRRASTRKHRGGQAAVNAPTTILSTPEEEAAARLNPQWYTENTVIPGFRGWTPVPGQAPSAPQPPKPAAGGAKKKANKNKKAGKNARRTTRKERR